MAVLCGHRTGVWTGLTLEEWLARTEVEAGVNIQHAGGKTGRHTGSTSVVLHKHTALVLQSFVSVARPLLRTAETSGALLPGLQPFSLLAVEPVFRLRPGELPKLLKGNSCRQYHASLTLELFQQGRISHAQLEAAASYRRHSSAVAAASYDRRNQAVQDSRVQLAVMEVARQAAGLASGDGDGSPAPNE